VGVGSWVVCAASPTGGARTWSVGVGTWSVCRIFDNEGQVNIRASSHRGGSWRTSERLLIAADHTICGSSAGTWSVGVGSWLVCATSSIVGARTWAVGAGTWSVCRIFDNEGQDGVNGRRNLVSGGRALDRGCRDLVSGVRGFVERAPDIGQVGAGTNRWWRR
jgi:hypothetical protein